MSDKGFIKLPRDFLEDSKWISARSKHKVIFLTILQNCAFNKTTYDIQGKTIDIFPGQVCITIRKLEEWSGNDISKNDVEGALVYFSRVKFLRQEVRHRKSIITIIEPSICIHCFSANQTTNQTEIRQRSDIKEEQQEQQEHKKKIKKEANASKKAAKPAFVASADASRLTNDFLLMIKSYKPDFKEPSPSQFINWQKEMSRLLKDRGEARIVALIKWIPGSWWNRCVFSVSGLKSKFDQIEMAIAASMGDEIIRNNERFFYQLKGDYPKDLKHMVKSGEYIKNTNNNKEVHLKMVPEAFERVFAQVAGVDIV